MIVDVKKYLFIGLKNEIEAFFEKAQKLGVIEFLPSSGKKPLMLPKSSERLLSAIKILKKEVKPVDKAYVKEQNPQDIADKVLFLKSQIEKDHEKLRQLKIEIERVHVFGDFSLLEFKKIEKETDFKLSFFTSPLSKREMITIPQSLIYVGSDLALDYFVALEEGSPSYPNFTKIHIDKTVGQLRKEQQATEERLKISHKELKELVYYLDVLKTALIDELNIYHLNFSKDEVLSHLDESMFSIQAWIPTRSLDEVDRLIRPMVIVRQEIALEEGDNVPTCMVNKNLRHVGEDLVKIYDIPSPVDKDPSGFVIAAFALFFSMIVADAGYGLVYFILSLLGYFKYRHKSPSMKRMMKLFVTISSGCILWGVCIGSFFGIPLSPQNSLQKASVLQYVSLQKARYHMETKDDVYQEWVDKYPQASLAKTPLEFLLSGVKKQGQKESYEILEEFNDNILIEIALLVGVIHICLSLLRYSARNFSSIGWVLFILGGYLYFPSMLKATSILNFTYLVSKKFAYEFGLQLLFIGAVLAWLLALIQKRKKGLEEPLQAIQIFADILSYLRLYALALAGMILATTFNQIGQEIGFAFGSVIIIIGHITNMTLGIMGGFIHGLRLNFLEWYHYCFEGGGKLFNPLKLLK